MSQAANGGNGSRAWMAWTLGALFAILLPVVATVRAGDIARIDKLEQQQDDVQEAAQVSAQKFSVEIAVLQTNMQEVKDTLGRIESSQASTNAKLSALLSVIDQNSSRYQAAMRQYQDTLDAMRRR